MNRRQMLCLLGAAGAMTLWAPATLWAETPDALASKAQDLLSSGHMDKALPLLLEAQTKDGRNDRVQALLGRVYMQQGDARRALEHFRLAVRINPEDTLSRMMAETISQFPLPKHPGDEKERPMGRPSSTLVGEANAERQALLQKGAAPRRPGPFRLLIDPGHGGSDPGIPGSGPRESDVALDLSLRLARLLVVAKDTVAVTLTRTADVTLPGWARTALAGFYGADLFLSLHAARVKDPRAAGIIVYSLARVATNPAAAAAAEAENTAYGRSASYLESGGQGVFVSAARQAAGAGLQRREATLAGVMAKALPAASPLPPRGTGAAPFRLLAETDAPALLIEAGFLSHPDDQAVLASADKRQALAQSLATAVLAGINASGSSGGGE
jgi:N-acetylmuramoyl-L-alanine amidase